MVTRQRTTPIPKQRPAFYIREWRKFMGMGAVPCADALDIARTSYLRLERETWRLGLEDAQLLADHLGVTLIQLQFPPPKEGDRPPPSLDGMLAGKPESLRQIAIGAVEGIIANFKGQ